MNSSLFINSGCITESGCLIDSGCIVNSDSLVNFGSLTKSGLVTDSGLHTNSYIDRFYFNRSLLSVYDPLYFSYTDIIHTPSIYYLIKDQSFFRIHLVLFLCLKNTSHRLSYDSFWIIMKRMGHPLATLPHGWFHHQLFYVISNHKKDMGEYDYMKAMEIMRENYVHVSLPDFCFHVLSDSSFFYPMIQYDTIYQAIVSLGPPDQRIPHPTKKITRSMLELSLTFNYSYLISKSDYEEKKLYDIIVYLFRFPPDT